MRYPLPLPTPRSAFLPPRYRGRAAPPAQQELSKLARFVVGHECAMMCDGGRHRSAGTLAALLVLMGCDPDEVERERGEGESRDGGQEGRKDVVRHVLT